MVGFATWFSRIESQLGRGTITELWLPVSNMPLETAIVSGAKPRLRAVGTVLLVDDEEFVRMSTAEMLGDLGYEIVEAGSAEEALERVKGGLRPTLLVTDHLMQGMNGTDLARMLRAIDSKLQILIVSGYAEEEGIAADLPRLTKPFRNEELAASLASLSLP